MTDSPAWGYKMEDGKIVSHLFEDGKLPTGWADSPAKCDEVPKKRGRPKKDAE